MRKEESQDVSIHFLCPHCGAATDVAEKFAGEMGPCAHCGKAITIPNPGGMASTPARTTTITTTIIAILTGVLAFALLGAGMLAMVWLPTTKTDREAARRMQCANNLRQIAAAMQEYQSVNGHFPPACISDKHGKPMHSWRVLLLPYLGQKDLYDQYRFDEPWNSDNNRSITDLTIAFYQCPSQPDATEPVTNYMMVVGPHTISSGPAGRKIAEITDGLENTIMLVEVADSTIPWAEPRDLQFDKLDFAVNGKRPCISSYHPGGANVVFCDGSARLLKDAMNPQLVKAMLTIDGGESTSAEK